MAFSQCFLGVSLCKLRNLAVVIVWLAVRAEDVSVVADGVHLGRCHNIRENDNSIFACASEDVRIDHRRLHTIPKQEQVANP